MKNILLNFVRKSFIKNTLILVSGTALAQGVNMLFTPLITRIFGPEAYGIMGTFLSIISIISPIAALTYPISIVLPPREEEAKSLVGLSLIITSINTIAISILLIILGDLLIGLFNLESVSSFLIFIPFVVFCAGISEIMEQYLIRKKQFKISAQSTLIEVLLTNGGKLIIGLFYPVASVLIIFSALRKGIKGISMFLISDRSIIKNIFNYGDNKKEFLNLSKKYKDFPLYRAPERFFNAISGNLPLLLLTTFFGPVSAGFYSLARTVLGVPIQLLGVSVGKVFFPRVSEAANNNEKIAPLITRATFYLAIVAAIPFAIIILFGPWLFSFIFGEEWAIAGEYARWLAIWSYFTFINRPSVQSLPVLSAQRFLLIFTVSSLLLKLIALLIGFYIFESDIISLALFGITGGLTNIYLIITTIVTSKKYDKFNFDK